MKYILAIDKGTSVVKCILYTQDGEERAIALRDSKTYQPQLGWHEEDLTEAWELISELIREILATSNITSKEIAGIGITSHMGGLILLDENGKPLYPNILWDDSRASNIISQWIEQGIYKEIVQEGGQALLAGLTIPLIKWFEVHKPDILNMAKYLCNTKDFLVYRLTGNLGTDESDGGWMPFDVRKRNYSTKIWQLAGIEQYSHLFPPIRKSIQIAGELQPAPAKEIGLTPGIPVITGIGDANASTIGVGVIKPGQAVSIIGTSLLNNIITPSVTVEPEGLGFNIPTIDNYWMRMLPNTGGGSINIKWLVEVLYASEKDPYTAVDIDVNSSPLGSKGVFYHPYISNAGVVAPFYNLGARAQFLGLHVEAKRKDLARATFEGLAYSMRDCYESCPIILDEIRLSGGAARSHTLCQIVADVLGKIVLLPMGEEAAARGVAILVSRALGFYRTTQEAVSQFVKTSKTFEPNLQNHSIYSELFHLFKKSRLALEEFWNERHKRYSSY